MGAPFRLDVQTASDHAPVASGAPKASPGPEGLSTLEGVLGRVVYRQSGGDYVIARFDVADRPVPHTIKGRLPGVQEGERLRLQGRWVEDPRFGRQFLVASFLPVAPDTVEAIRRFLVGRGAGVGPVMAGRLVDHFGSATLDVLDNHPERLLEVPGIGRVRAERLLADWAAHRDTRDVLIFLQGLGIASGLAGRILRRFGRDTLATVRSDPFALCGEVRGVGFLTADRVATALGIAPDSPHRVRAGLRHILEQAEDEGHCFLPEREVLDRGVELLSAAEGVVHEEIATLVDEGALIAEIGALPGDARALWLPELHAAEVTVARRLKQILSFPPKPWGASLAEALASAQDRAGFTLSETQREALLLLVERKVLVLTGGPGTGKTTLLRAAVDLLERAGQRVRVAAPTGRAARRLEEATGRKASTIHRLLEWDPEVGHFIRGADRPLSLDALVLDECSMVDVALFAQTLVALPDAARLLLVGDADQLPSVGPGRVLGDIVDGGSIPVVRLDAVFRQDQEGLIHRNAHELLRGRSPRSSPKKDGDFFVIPRDDPEAAAETVVHVVKERIPAAFGLDPLRDVQVLCPMRKGACGAEALNQRLRAALNPLATEGVALAVGDRVMQIRNDYDKDLSNGDVGFVESVEDGGRFVVRFGSGALATYERDERDDIELAWATTIHKSQGSEYAAVVIPVVTQHWRMLQRQLLYTAITRGRRLVVLVGQGRAIEQAVGNATANDRHTALGERLRLEMRPGSVPPRGPTVR